MSSRPLLHSPPSLQPNVWTQDDDSHFDHISPSSAYIVDSPSLIQSKQHSPTSPQQKQPSHFARSPSDDDASFDTTNPQSPSRSPKQSALPDPSQYPDPYPFHPPQRAQGTSTPALSCADSSSASTRSSAYTNSARSGDYGHVHVAVPGDDPEAVGVGITTDAVVQLLARDPAVSSSSSSQPRSSNHEHSRWSDAYANSVRSRSSSGANAKNDHNHDSDIIRPTLRATPSFDMNWQPVDERDEIGLTSEDETDEDALQDEDEHEDEEQPTSAMIIAEEGLGVIVRGDDTPIVQLSVHSGRQSLSSQPGLFSVFIPRNLSFFLARFVIMHLLSACSRHSSYNPPAHRIFQYPKRRPLVPCQPSTSNHHNASRTRHFRKLPGCSSSGPCVVHMPRGVEYSVKSSSCSSSFSLRPNLSQGSNRRFS
ncbi:hypothetical protein NLI96_g8776 [Meripilus lineatus]|uniref:Uncharacterized protein n=1 Tax=Meripilus lineatus TaxID=2056292 RepID=A0AAD5UYC6_9APHY|nr:hypothetical protein NLI96_g8776 [Physisporinus lineatus]